MNFQHSRLAGCAKAVARIKRVGAVLALAIVSSSALAASSSHTVVIENMKFSPSVLEVKRGDTVVWANKDFFPHDVTENNGRFRSDTIPSQGSWKFIAKKRGQFPYRCSLHPVMTAVIVVK